MSQIQCGGDVGKIGILRRVGSVVTKKKRRLMRAEDVDRELRTGTIGSGERVSSGSGPPGLCMVDAASASLFGPQRRLSALRAAHAV